MVDPGFDPGNAVTMAVVPQDNQYRKGPHPALDLAMAFFGGSYGDRGTFLAQDNYVPNFILPAAEGHP